MTNTVTTNLYVAVNDHDVDEDWIVDWADGYNWNLDWDWWFDEDDTCYGAPYGTIHMQGSSAIKKDECRLKMTYSDTWPLDVDNYLTTNSGVVITNWVLPDNNGSRLWMHQLGSGPLSGWNWGPAGYGGDFIPANEGSEKWTWEYYRNLFGGNPDVMGWDGNVYIEAVRPGWQRVIFEVYANGKDAPIGVATADVAQVKCNINASLPEEWYPVNNKENYGVFVKVGDVLPGVTKTPVGLSEVDCPFSIQVSGHLSMTNDTCYGETLSTSDRDSLMTATYGSYVDRLAVTVCGVELDQTNSLVDYHTSDYTVNVDANNTFISTNSHIDWSWVALSGTGTLSVVTNNNDLFTFTPSNSVPGSYRISASDYLSGAYDACTVGVVRVDIVQTNIDGHVYCTNCIPFNLAPGSWTNVAWSISPSLGTNGAQFSATSNWTGSGFATTNGTNVWVYSGPVSNTYTLTAYAVEFTNAADTATFNVLKPKFIDLNWLETTNEALHHTSLYQTNALVLRRADKFKVEAKLSKGYTNTCFDVWFQAVQNFDGTPKTNDIPVVPSDLAVTNWYCKLLSTSNNADQTTTVQMEINIPSTNCPIGEYQWSALVVPKVAPSVILDTTNFSGQVIILFNPWSINDSVYMANDADRQEYVMRTSGIMWQGERISKIPKTWRYAQFNAISIAVLLSELNGQDSSKRQNAILVSRHLSSRVNSNGGGVLVGRWDGNYAGGTDPLSWNGSDQILTQYKSTGTAVQYGQCWVFGGLLTTMLRSSGIPARPLTTFDSAHDTNGNKVIEFRYRTDGTRDRSRSEKIWNYHVWCDAWMTRPDQTGQDGWQAVDATPQETSGGEYQCGPASHAAVKGNLGGNYDVDFVYAEVSADVQKWKDVAGGGEVLQSTLHDQTGHDISTKTVGADTRHDITSEYK